MATTFEKAETVDPTTARGIALIAWRLHWISPKCRRASLAVAASVGALTGALVSLAADMRPELNITSSWWMLLTGLPMVFIRSYGGPDITEFLGNSSRALGLLPLSKRQLWSGMLLQYFILPLGMLVPPGAVMVWFFADSDKVALYFASSAVICLLGTALLRTLIRAIPKRAPYLVIALPVLSWIYLAVFALIMWNTPEVHAPYFLPSFLLAIIAFIFAISTRVSIDARREAPANFVAHPRRWRGLLSLLQPSVIHAFIMSIGAGLFLSSMGPLLDADIDVIEIFVIMSIIVISLSWRNAARAIRPLPVSTAGLSMLLLLQAITAAACTAFATFIITLKFNAFPYAIAYGCVTGGAAAFLWVVANSIYSFDSGSTASVATFLFLVFRKPAVEIVHGIGQGLNWQWHHTMVLAAVFVLGAVARTFVFYRENIWDSRNYTRPATPDGIEAATVRDAEDTVWTYYAFSVVLILMAMVLN